jgi:hypothetical protein
MQMRKLNENIFAPPSKMAKSLKDAAATLGTEDSPTSATNKAAETLWSAAINRKPGSTTNDVARSIQVFTVAVFERIRGQEEARLAARLAGHRFLCYRKKTWEDGTSRKRKGSA